MSDKKLLRAMGAIKAILKREDIAASVILHNTPGQLEILLALTPSYSKLQEYMVTDHGVSFRLRSKLADYNGDVEAQKRDLAATANMCSGLAKILGETALTMIETAQWVDKATGAEHSDLEET